MVTKEAIIERLDLIQLRAKQNLNVVLNKEVVSPNFNLTQAVEETQRVINACKAAKENTIWEQLTDTERQSWFNALLGSEAAINKN